MKIEFDEAKNRRNIEKRALPFSSAADFEFETASIIVDDRKDYGEVRYVATGYLGDRLHVLAFTAIEGGIRVISFRKANQREVKRYEQEE